MRPQGLIGTRQRSSNWRAIFTCLLDEKAWETLSGYYKRRWLIRVWSRYVYVIRIFRMYSFDLFLTRCVLTTKLIILCEYHNRRDQFNLTAPADSVNSSIFIFYFYSFYLLTFGNLRVYYILWLNLNVNFDVDLNTTYYYYCY